MQSMMSWLDLSGGSSFILWFPQEKGNIGQYRAIEHFAPLLSDIAIPFLLGSSMGGITAALSRDVGREQRKNRET